MHEMLQHSVASTSFVFQRCARRGSGSSLEPNPPEILLQRVSGHEMTGLLSFSPHERLRAEQAEHSREADARRLLFLGIRPPATSSVRRNR